MWLCSGTHSESKPRCSSSTARVAGWMPAAGFMDRYPNFTGRTVGGRARPAAPPAGQDGGVTVTSGDAQRVPAWGHAVATWLPRFVLLAAVWCLVAMVLTPLSSTV